MVRKEGWVSLIEVLCCAGGGWIISSHDRQGTSPRPPHSRMCGCWGPAGAGELAWWRGAWGAWGAWGGAEESCVGRGPVGGWLLKVGIH
jgi:hypothetical protein